MKDVRTTKTDLPSPKRGAIPTPKADIEKATPYIPDSDQAVDQPGKGPVPPTDADQKDNHRANPKAPESR
jgi:hypothetical protein